MALLALNALTIGFGDHLHFGGNAIPCQDFLYLLVSQLHFRFGLLNPEMILRDIFRLRNRLK